MNRCESIAKTAAMTGNKPIPTCHANRAHYPYSTVQYCIHCTLLVTILYRGTWSCKNLPHASSFRRIVSSLSSRLISSPISRRLYSLYCTHEASARVNFRSRSPWPSAHGVTNAWSHFRPPQRHTVSTVTAPAIGTV